MQFVKATKEKSKARIALIGPSGSGKTWTALTLAPLLGDRIALIDTENGSASKYAADFDFSTLSLAEHSPQNYVQAIQAAERAGFDVLIIDSLSHAWTGRGGALEQVDRAAKKYQGNSFAAWRDVTPHHNALVDALVQCSCHLIVTMRAKTEYVLQENSKGKLEPRKVGLAPVQRDGLEYEFDIVADMDIDHNLIVSKTRCRSLDGAVITLPGPALGVTIRDWLTTGAAPAALPPKPAVVEPQKAPEQPSQPAPAPKPKNGNGHQKSNPQKLFDEVQSRTNNYYQNLPHLSQTIGGWPNFANQDDIDARLSIAVDHAKKETAQQSN